MNTIYLVISHFTPLKGYIGIIDSVALLCSSGSENSESLETQLPPCWASPPYLNARHERAFTTKELKQSHGTAGAGQRYLAELKTAKIHCAVPCCSPE